MSDTIAFLRAWLADPLRFSALVPSSRSLEQATTSQIDADCGRVIALGDASGAVSRALIARGVAEADLVLVEEDAASADRLRRSFPDAAVFALDAGRLRFERLPSSGRIGAVVSALPLLSLPAGKVVSILRGAFRHLRDGGAFYQSTPTVRGPVPARVLDLLDLEAICTDWTAVTVPPAWVYRITRRAPAA